MRLMIIGQLEGHISTAGKIALQRGAKVAHCDDTETALGALRNGKGADLVMIDVKQKIAPFIETLRAERIAVPVVACGIGTDARAAVKAIQDGAKEYVPLPPDAELIAAVLAAVTEENNAMIADDPAMQKVLAVADKIAPSEATVLITGDSGTGKEVMSRYIHRKSKRGNGPFIALNCAAIPENLLESELFGHEKGSFTGATARRLGKFEEATGGTLLLDEITEMAVGLQAKLLRAIQEREINRIGSNDSIKIDVRIIATSNRDMAASVKAGQFREDLYFRLNVVNIRLPSLRERPADVARLAQFYADKYADVNGVAKRKIGQQAAAKLQTYTWPGNIRELENTMHRAILVAVGDMIEPDDVAIEVPGFHNTPSPSQGEGRVGDNGRGGKTPPTPAPSPLQGEGKSPQNPGGVEGLIGRKLEDVERDMILNTLDHTLGNRTHAATILGISIRTLRNKLAQYRDEGIDVPTGSEG
jgi:two-component system response regulator FlrC